MPEIEKLLTELEAAEIARVGKATIRYWRQIGKLPFIKPGRHPLIIQSELLKFLLKPESARISAAGDKGRI